MPGETEQTIKETGEFLASMRYLQNYDWNVNLPLSNWAMALPGTPLYEYGKQLGLIGQSLDEDEKYLELTSNSAIFKRYYYSKYMKSYSYIFTTTTSIIYFFIIRVKQAFILTVIHLRTEETVETSI